MILKKKNINFKKWHPLKLSFILGTLVGLFIFLFIYGIKVLNFQNVEWLYNSGDLTQHYVGWTFFRNSPWSFPLGMSNNYGYPFGVAITYTDSIPLFAIFFKLLNPILPTNFQYFGLFQLLSFMLQGGFAAIIIRKYIKNNYITIIGSALVVISPILLRRVFIHTALTSHWLILFALSIWVYREHFKSLKSKILIWILINSLSVLIHPYFMPMTLIIMVATIVADSINLKTIKEMFLVSLSSILSIIIIFWIIGGFTGESLEAAGLGRFSMNLNSFFDSNGWSSFLKDLPTVFFEQYEGFQYLGLGVILLIPLALIFLIKNLLLKKTTLKRIFKNYYSILIVLIPLGILSLSTTIAINEKVLFQYTLPKWLEGILSIFRSTGRLFWPVTYIFILFLIIYTAKNISKPNITFVLLLVLTFIQLFDINIVISESQKHYKEDSSFNTILKSNLWDDVGKNFNHIMILPAYDSTYSFFGKLATDYNMTLNVGSFARGPYDDINALADKTALDLVNGLSDADTVYIIQKFGLVKDIMLNDKERKFIVAKVDNTDNCFAIFRKDCNINFNNYKDIVTYSHEDFKTLSLDEYFSYLNELPSNVVTLISTSGKVDEFIDSNIIKKLKEFDLLKNTESLEGNLAYAALKINGEEPIINEVLAENLAIIDLAAGSNLGDFNNKRVININGSAIENNNYSINLLDGFQHSFDQYGINFLVYDIENNKVLDCSLLDGESKEIISMRWK